MTDKIEVFNSVVKRNLDGNELEIHLGTFIESEKLLSVTIKGYKQEKLDMDLLLEPEFKEALLPLLKKCFWNKNNIIDYTFFDDIAVRPYYIDICLAVMEENNKPFMSRLLSSSLRATQETDTDSVQK